MHIIAWTDELTAHQYPIHFMQCGGIFKKGWRWNQYIEFVLNNQNGFLKLSEISLLNDIRFSIIDNEIRTHMVPVFEDGTVPLFTPRGFADLLAASWAEEENKDYGYEDFIS